jgi:hypothetical protein
MDMFRKEKIKRERVKSRATGRIGIATRINDKTVQVISEDTQMIVFISPKEFKEKFKHESWTTDCPVPEWMYPDKVDKPVQGALFDAHVHMVSGGRK